MVTIQDVASFFIERSYKDGIPITHLKLQKLCYYAQAWHLVLSSKKEQLFDAKFQAWVHGPVNTEIFSKYRNYGWNPIKSEKSKARFNDDQESILNEVWEAYGHHDAKFLESLTHQEEPWIEARKGLAEDDYSNNPISEKTMKRYYSKL
ncbi:type II toxin-antitoxin system antitoxin SocA domain-containing protein [Paenibacillus sp. FSL R10-2796]|uniref:Panacea domain-containing protein n=1 Tax=unclassified Paenibacillus TaxID=185978 RepID=UPI0030DD50AE